ncbi:CHAT domain-containing protein [Stigmatella aurantiaca]|uniref:CHAT domain-containing protein n=1 Tax=Stigmatella aurantiaca (strain DW4/3-1) TaxID=378806 RepID=Q09AK7_STIAD|nr:CHAT domain-containing protein [Stigmatella aurantiaca]ADO68056.1 uncharacterized protein STAUR_0247 [Stigmatella aurantiaca DW4/3-1]EAU68704.1 conserved hypothetical protein [Stigmatella aurantiaca DW4/3-1]
MTARFFPKRAPPPTPASAELRYLALLLFPDGRTHTVDLGPAEPIDQAALRLQEALARRNTDVLAVAQSLYALAFQPLMPLLGDSRRLFVSPDGQLTLVPFAALHDGDHFLADAFEFTYLTSGKDLLPRADGSPVSRSVVVLADPGFASPTEELAQEGEAVAVQDGSAPALRRFFSTPRSELADRPWPPLPGTRQEAKAIQHLLPEAQLLLGHEATKTALLSLRAPGILHIATHGFFLEDSTPSADLTRTVAHFGAVGDAGPARSPDPLLRAGLVLSGASAERSPPGVTHEEAFLVTALELSGMNLWGTQLVVLSACDTGRGDVKLGQGVYGLRRALVVAGTQTVVTSLWKVSDEVTSELMERYYRHLLGAQGRAMALQQAMRELRQKHPHPHYWAPFISIGQEAPLLRAIRSEGSALK